ncbi:retinol dehydrogenase 12-like [Ornithodoros turicata]|uniref:retinol dehydrogenase 12-like n=1 Tax=Ornithodoros turicata TaxID=34597 RepID=UPI0031395871
MSNALPSSLKCVAVVGVSCVGIYLVRRYIAGAVCRTSLQLNGKVAIVTGANSGIGLEVARELAKRGARVYLACRDMSKATDTALKIIFATGNTDVFPLYLEVSSLDSVREFAKEFLAGEQKLDILVNNAAVFGIPFQMTDDGHEKVFATNYLGHFLVTMLLLDALKSAAPSRVINLTSDAYKYFRSFSIDKIHDERGYGVLKAYSQSKLALIYFTQELHRRYNAQGIASFAVNPGRVRTNIMRQFRAYLAVENSILWPLKWLLTKSSWEGAQTPLHCCMTKEALKFSGCYFEECKPTDVKPFAKDPVTASQLWNYSEEMAGLSKPVPNT